MKTRGTLQSGFSLIEVLVASTLLVLMVYAVGTLSITGTEAQDYARRLNRATEINQDLLDDLRLDLVSSVRLFGSDAWGTAYRDALDLTDAPVPLATSRLPAIDPVGNIRRDVAGNEITGNSLMYARHAWSAPYQCISGNQYSIDVYRIVYYYLTPEGSGPGVGLPFGLNLVRITSEPLADAGQVDKIADPVDRAEVLLNLNGQVADLDGRSHPRVDVVWNRGEAMGAVGTLRQINPGDGSLSDSPMGARPNPWNILRDGSPVGGLLSFRHHSVATNDARSVMGVGRFALSSTAAPGFPHGLEIQIVGPSAARQVLVHLVLVSTNRRGQTAWSNLQSVIDARDL